MEFWLYLHILLLVFWVGTDLGVFLAARYSERSDLSVESRQVVLELGMKLDRLPRTALVLIIPSGVMLASGAGLVLLDGLATTALWGFALIWLAILWRGFLSKSPAVQAQSAKINWWLNLAAAILTLLWAVMLFLSGSAPMWLILKIAIVGGIFVVGFLLDFLFGPAMGLFAQVCAEPSRSDLNADYGKALVPVYWTVIAIYVLALAAAALGVFKI
ncbi:MAG: hypothetical protein RI942_2032 [Pseudomonadota bacterium]|jgi:hypothetical protein